MRDAMSNKDVNGYELPWILKTEPYPVRTGENSYRMGMRQRIIVNQSYERAAICDDSWALCSAILDATVHLQPKAADAVAAHIRDAHKWANL